MESIAKFITNNELLVLISLFLVIVILLVIVIVTDYINRKKEEENSKDLIKDRNFNINNAFKEELNEETMDLTKDLSGYKDVMVIEDEKNNNLVSEIKYVEDDNEELEKTKAQEELKHLKEELIRRDQLEKEEQKKQKTINEETINEIRRIVKEKFDEESKINLEKTKELDPVIININDIKEEEKENIIDTSKDMERDLLLERQEKEAIISIDQFNKLSDKIYELNEEIQYEDEGNEPISIQELEEYYKTKEINLKEIQEAAKEEKIIEKQPEPKKIELPDKFTLKDYKDDNNFKSSPQISPVYGYNNISDQVNLKEDNTTDLEKLSEELRKTTEFLNTLKELRKNLE